MKFAWKIFIATFLIVLLALSLGGTLMVSISFSSSLRTEKERIANDNRMMMTEIATLIGNYNKTIFRNEKDALKSVLASLSDNWATDNKKFRIIDEAGTSILESTGMEKLSRMKPNGTDTLSFQIVQTGKNYYIQAITSMELREQTIWIENGNEISSVFITRSEQKERFLKIILIVGGICAVLNGIFTRWLTGPVTELTKATKRITDGNMSIRVQVKSRDELGTLASNFNGMADALQEKIQELEGSARKQEDFVGSFAHEIKTPLTSIIGYADLLRSRKLDDNMVFEAANYIFSEGKRLEGLSIKLLELLVEGKQEPDYNIIFLGVMVKEVLEVLQPAIQEKAIDITLDIPEMMVKADKDLMKTVIMNLIDNARKAVEMGGSIKLDARIEDENVILNITDNGRGIPKDDLNKITEAFYTVDKSRSRVEGGSGLGLAICTQILKFHHGKLTFESELGYGTSAILVWKGVVR
ncbi:MAG: HAMP domain-containing sensor histidine kinase [Herbinix sp.]|nr:HAMP domain-containing sensor histidine kinase [Herbinix sp.]